MTSCAEVRAGLVALLRGELRPDEAAGAVAHLAACDACRAEREALRRTLLVVRLHAEPAVSTDARLRLRAALEAELARAKAPPPRRVSHAYLVPVALAAGALVAWMLPRDAAVAPLPSQTSAAASWAAQRRPGDELSARSMDAAGRGLAWLLARQDAGGAWTPSPDTGDAGTAAATASALLAFAADGQSPTRGPNAAALARGRDRLLELAAAGFNGEAAPESVYTTALAVRGLAALWSLDRESMDPDARRRFREVLAGAGRGLVAAQCDDGGFGYAPDAPSADPSCTLFAAAALVELRRSGVVDASGALGRARRYLEGVGTAALGASASDAGRRHDAAARNAAILSLDGDLGERHRADPAVLDAVRAGAARGDDVLLAWTGAEALARHGASLESPVRSLLEAQRGDGAWPAQRDLRCAAAGDEITTAFGVLALAQVYAR